MTTTPPDARNALADELLKRARTAEKWLRESRAAFERERKFHLENQKLTSSLRDSLTVAEDRIAALEAQVEGMRVAFKRILNGKEIADKRYPGSTVVIDLPLDKIEEICRAALQSSETTGEK
jgi:hypothetical protein